VKITIDILSKTDFSNLIIGLVIFSVGTNLPEIIIAISSWKLKASELSLSHLVSSAFTNILMLGILVMFKPINFVVSSEYYSMAFYLVLTVGLFLYFSYARKKLDRKEGIILLSVYILFLLTNIFLMTIK
jgi:cation:H+ antiporter